MKRIIALLLLPLLLVGCSPAEGKSSMSSSLDSEETPRAKVVVLAGQSNMEGNSWSSYLSKHYTTSQIDEYINGYSTSKIVWNDSWGNFKNISPYVDVKLGQGTDENHFGPELAIAQTIDKAHRGETIYFIKFGWGGSNLINQWRSPSSGATGPLWTEFISFVKDSLAILKFKGLDPQICALCWMQGESDSDTVDVANQYYGRLSNFVKDFRSEFEAYTYGPGIGFVDAYISNSIAWAQYKIINEAKQKFADEDILNVAIDTIALNLSFMSEPYYNVDIYHYDSDGMIGLGTAFGNALLEYFI